MASMQARSPFLCTPRGLTHKNTQLRWRCCLVTKKECQLLKKDLQEASEGTKYVPCVGVTSRFGFTIQDFALLQAHRSAVPRVTRKSVCKIFNMCLNPNSFSSAHGFLKKEYVYAPKQWKEDIGIYWPRYNSSIEFAEWFCSKSLSRMHDMYTLYVAQDPLHAPLEVRGECFNAYSHLVFVDERTDDIDFTYLSALETDDIDFSYLIS